MLKDLSFIYFLYGLAFFTMGIAVLIRIRPLIDTRRAKTFGWLAAFGIIHAVHEWIEMFMIMGHTEKAAALFVAALFAALSFAVLLKFGIDFIDEKKNLTTAPRMLPVIIFSLWFIFFVKTFLSGEIKLAGIMARYTMGFPGTFLAAYVFISNSKRFSETPHISRNFVLAGVFFAVYCVLTVITPRADFFPASIFNYPWFSDLTGYPVQAFRGLCALAVTYFVVMSLDVFDVREKNMLVEKVGKSEMKSKQIEEERESLAQQLLQSQKIEAIGQLAGGMAHDFNNMLTVIMGNANLALSDIKKDDHNYVEFKEIMNASERARDMTMKLLTFARKEKIDVRTVKISRILNELKTMLERTFPKKIKVETELQEDILVSIDTTQIQQALLNICTNARDAMPDGGTLMIECRETVLDDEYCEKYDNVKSGHYCIIQISDTGAGIPKEIIHKVIEPFFTTKGTGKGTGLGLSVTFGIVKSHNGIIRIYSEQGHGTTVSIYLPIEVVAEYEGRKEIACETERGTETILIVDDEEPVLELAERMLAKAGYTIIATDNGAEAVELYRERSKEIALVMLDMIMPEMDGGDVYRALREIDPDVKVVLSSGYSINGQAGKLMKEGIQSFVQKPFTRSALCSTMRRVLDEQANKVLITN